MLYLPLIQSRNFQVKGAHLSDILLQQEVCVSLCNAYQTGVKLLILLVWNIASASGKQTNKQKQGDAPYYQ